MADPLYPYTSKNGKAFNGNWWAFLPLTAFLGLGFVGGLLAILALFVKLTVGA